MSIGTATKLSKTQAQLLNGIAVELMDALAKEPGAKHLRSMAFQHWDTDLNKEVQIQVLVTNDARKFLEPFHPEEMS